MKLKPPRLSFPITAAPTPATVEPLPAKKHTGVDYETEWARSFGARMARLALLEGVIGPTMQVLASPDRAARAAYEARMAETISTAEHAPASAPQGSIEDRETDLSETSV